jgi:hypothetical protein
MRTKLVETNKPERYIHVVLNNDTVQINAGTPLVLDLSAALIPATSVNGLPPGYQDGMAVVLPSTAGATPSSYLAYGVALGNIPVNTLGEAQVHGLVKFALITVQTRTASTNSWSTVASVNSMALLVIDTLNNAYVTTNSSTATVTAGSAATQTNTVGALSAGQEHALLIDTIATIAASATTSADTRTAILAGYRVFVRQM